jgi:hypothetical protein
LITQRTGDARFPRSGIVNGIALGVKGLAFEPFSCRAARGVAGRVVDKLRFAEHPPSIARGATYRLRSGIWAASPRSEAARKFSVVPYLLSATTVAAYKPVLA